MTPEKKATELMKKHANNKDTALITVNEVITQWEHIDTYLADLGGELNPNLKHWYKVKEIIKNM